MTTAELEHRIAQLSGLSPMERVERCPALDRAVLPNDSDPSLADGSGAGESGNEKPAGSRRAQSATGNGPMASIATGTDIVAEVEISPKTATMADTVSARLSALQEMDYAALRAEWRRLYRAQPPKRVARDLLVLGVAWRIQEQAYGGLGAADKRRLAELSRSLERTGDITRSRVARLKPGAKLVRTWHGEAHTVTVVEDGYAWKGRTWRSLSVIARQITGVQWSGPRFFGLTAGRPAGPAGEEPADA